MLAQIDRIAQARAELDKAHARMLLGFRAVLTLEQWKKLEAEEPPRAWNIPNTLQFRALKNIPAGTPGIFLNQAFTFGTSCASSRSEEGL